MDVSLPNISASVPTYYSIAPKLRMFIKTDRDLMGCVLGIGLENTDDLNDLYIKSRSEGFGDEVKRRILIGHMLFQLDIMMHITKKAQQVRRLLKMILIMSLNQLIF